MPVLKLLLWDIRCSCVAYVLQYLFQQLGVIVAIVKLHIRSYLDDIFELIKVCCSW